MVRSARFRGGPELRQPAGGARGAMPPRRRRRDASSGVRRPVRRRPGLRLGAILSRPVARPGTQVGSSRKLMPIRNLALGALSTLAATLSLQAQCYEPATGSPIGTGDDAVLPIQALGFAFPFGGGTWTDVHVETNGRVFLSNGGVPAPGGADWTPLAAELVAGSPKIAPYWSDLNVISGTGNVLYNALPGKAVITWQNAVEYGN